MRKTYITAAAIAFLFIAWVATGLLRADQSVAEHPTLAEARAVAEQRETRVRVRARNILAEPYPERVRVRGRTENKRTVQVRAETTGRVVTRSVERGSRVAEGDLLCGLALEDRNLRVAQAVAGVEQARLEYVGSLQLRDRGFQSDTAIAQAKARLATAAAQLEAARLDVARTSIRAPFAGVVEETGLEVGDYAQPGTACARIVDLDPMLLVGSVSEQDVVRIGVGAAASGRLATGAVVSGSVSFVGQQADPDTRTYRVEVTLPNPEHRLRSGITTEIDIAVGTRLAHLISPSLFVLDDAGGVGVRTVGGDGRVQFHRVARIADDVDGVWVTGLPQATTLITVGEQLVVAGQRVEVQMQDESETDEPLS